MSQLLYRCKHKGPDTPGFNGSLDDAIRKLGELRVKRSYLTIKEKKEAIKAKFQ